MYEISVSPITLNTEKILMYVWKYNEEWKISSLDDSPDVNAKMPMDNYDDVECSVTECF